MFNLREKFRSLSVPHEGTRSNTCSLPQNMTPVRPVVSSSGSVLSPPEANQIQVLEDKKRSGPPQFLKDVYEELVSAFPLPFQHRHSRYLCQLFRWAADPPPGAAAIADFDSLFLHTPTRFLSEHRQVSTILEEFQFELSRATPPFRRDDYAFLLERYPRDEMKICGPIQVIFKPVKIIIIQDNFRVLKAALETSLHLHGEEHHKVMTTILQVVQQQNLFYQFFGDTLQDQLVREGEHLIFRETNTAIAKLLQKYLLLHGHPYLKKVVIPLLQKMAKKQKNYEINPILLDDISCLNDHIADVEALAASILEVIYQSQIPPALSVVCAVIKHQIESLSLNEGSSHSTPTDSSRNDALNLRSLAAGFFLHFLCPTFVDPASAGFSVVIPQASQRALILCAKLFQTLANGNQFEVGYMQAMNPFLERHRARFASFCESVVNRNQILENMKQNSSREAIEDIQKQFTVANQYVLDLHKKYPHFWRQNSRSLTVSEEYQSAWAEWEDTWHRALTGNETERRPDLSPSFSDSPELPVLRARTAPRSLALSMTSASFPELNNLASQLKAFEEANNKLKGDERPPSPRKRRTDTSEYPRSNDSIQLPDSLITPPTILVSPTSSVSPTSDSSRDNSKGRPRQWFSRWNRRFLSSSAAPSSTHKKNASVSGVNEVVVTRENPLFGKGLAVASAQSSSNQVTLLREGQFRVALAPLQVSTSDLRHQDREFRMILRAEGTLQVPLPISHDERIRKHLYEQLGQSKSSFHQRLTCHLESWFTRYGTTANQLLQNPSDPSVYPPMYPAIQSILDCRNAWVLEIENKYPEMVDNEELQLLFLSHAERTIYDPAYLAVQCFYKYKYREENTRILQAIRAGRSLSMLNKTSCRLFPKQEDAYLEAIRELRQFCVLSSPTEKLFTLRNVVRCIYCAMFSSQLAHMSECNISLEVLCFNVGALDLIPLLIFLIGAAQLKTAFSEMMFLREHLYSYGGEELEYYFSLFQASVSILEYSSYDEQALESFLLNSPITPPFTPASEGRE